jgi:hypothetical protein
MGDVFKGGSFQATPYTLTAHHGAVEEAILHIAGQGKGVDVCGGCGDVANAGHGVEGTLCCCCLLC